MRALLVLLFLCTSSQAQTLSPPCMPYVDTPGWVWSTPKMSVTKNGAWYRWTCWSTKPGVPDQRVVYVGTLAEFPKIGGRIATIAKSADPLKSLQTLPQRITVLPLTDPSLAPILADAQR